METINQHDTSLNENELFWKEAAQAIDWDVPFSKTLDQDEYPSGRWFLNGYLNTCYNAVDRHVEAGDGDKTALVFDSAYSGQKLRYSYLELQDVVARTAGMISRHGVSKGDRVVIYMPMVPEAVFAMLACARIGAVHSVVFGGFAPKELAKRIDDAEPVLVLTASCGIEPKRVIAYKPILDEALSLCSHQPKNCILLQRDALEADISQSGFVDWSSALKDADPVPCVSVAATDPLYILYTSGTTGLPKGVVRDNGGHAVALIWTMKHVYGAQSDDVFWAASDIGWVVGHSYIVYAPLLLGCTTVLYEGKPVGTPDASAFWRMIEEYKINTLFTAPTAIRAIKGTDPQGKLLQDYDLSSLRALFLAGERSDPDTIEWSQDALGVPVIDHWWQTELGWPAIATCLGGDQRDIKIGTAGRAVHGYEFDFLDESHNSVGVGQSGDIVVKLPLPPGCLTGLWENESGFRKSYLEDHPGYYLTGDAGFIDEDGYISVMGRIDDVINVAGHRLSTGAIEEVVSAHKDIAECAVFAMPDATKGEVPVALFVLNVDAPATQDEVSSQVIADVRSNIGAVASFKAALGVSKLPKTRSGKILRGTIRKIAQKQTFDTPATIEDESALDIVKDALSKYASNA